MEFARDWYSGGADNTSISSVLESFELSYIYSC